ncbi:copper chaperone PCu(A)C [Stappia sp. F7233]|uniref:Copper chaperone PCu(A)C n=1 Tax=Stappia albiluteola TaxID=2758565 RepID=A0A839A7P5_9HYPH|nr:copper chaperone PCu(A)C [Stappia albiluteola]MBA5775580.1 copper chaperone PCu(A)C [Stappia albiluteola]
MRTYILLAAMAFWPISAQADVTVRDGWARASVLESRPTAAYLTLASDREDQLIGIASPVAGHVTIHAVKADASGVSRMVEIDALNMFPGKTVTLAPGGMHFMLLDLSQKLEKGTTLPLSLTFASGATMQISVPVLGPGASGPQGD